MEPPKIDEKLTVVDKIETKRTDNGSKYNINFWHILEHITRQKYNQSFQEIIKKKRLNTRKKIFLP